MTKDEALRLALEALEELNETNSYWWQEVDEVTTKKIDPAITAIKAALEAKDEPAAWKLKDVTDAYKLGAKSLQRKPLTDEDMDAVINGCPKYHGRFSTKDPDGKLNYYELVRAVEAAHGIKGEA